VRRCYKENENYIPRKIFLTKVWGHRERLTSFEMALRAVYLFNLVEYR
jgi:pyruvoyl-dependent arginine decarboxylase (PvlArgDC)